MSAPPTRRCAIYTRKNSEEGLEQSFNSLHAQREACEAYVASQTGEGWRAIATAYDDGGFSGGSMERPGLRRLLADVERGLIDVVVVYKVDRLTRSLGDFAKIVDIFDRKAVSFVSITQAFNTTTSMGRLTLNVLLSFAQFEREVTGERIRDKIAASKKKGLWMGGTVPLGYQVKDKRLVVHDHEAEVVRAIFRRYLELGSVRRLQIELEREGVRSKAWTTRAGRPKGAEVFSRGALFHLLRNRHYTGAILHKAIAYPDQHPPILEPELFDAVQAQLEAQRMRKPGSASHLPPAELTGLVFNGGERPLCPSFSRGRLGGTYRYYVGPPAGDPDAPPSRVPAEALERFLLHQLRRLCADAELTPGVGFSHLRRIDLRHASIELVVAKAAFGAARHPDLVRHEVEPRLLAGERVVEEVQDPTALRISLPGRAQFRGGRTWISGEGAALEAVRRRRSKAAGVGRIIRSAHALVRTLGASPLAGREMRPCAVRPAPITPA